MDAAKLVRMANQIAANFDYGPDKRKAVEGVVDHLRRFWSPPMRAELIEYYTNNGAGLGEIAARAVAELSQQARAAKE